MKIGQQSHNVLCCVVGALAICATTVMVSAAWATPIQGGGSGLRLWLDASDAATLVDSSLAPVADGGDVDRWLDKSGNNFHATAFGGNLPTRLDTSLNSQPALRFAAAQQDAMHIDSGLSLGRPYTVFTVDQYWGSTKGRSLHSRDVNWLTGKWMGLNAHFAEGWVAAGGTTNDADGLRSAANFVPVIGTALGNTAANSSAYFRNGFNVTDSPAPTGAPGKLILGAAGATIAGTEHSDFDMAEVIIYDRVLGGAERSILENYLGAKYGIVLNGSDRYAGDDTINGDYDFDVFGIGRTADGLDQVTAASSGGLSISAQNGTLGNNEWVFAGHAADSLAIVTTDLPSTAPFRSERAFYIDKTSIDGIDVELSFNLAEMGLSGTAGDWQLLYRPEANGTFSTLSLNGMLDGDVLTFSLGNVLLQNGIYTVAPFAPVPEPATLGMLALGVAGMAWRVRRRRPEKR